MGITPGFAALINRLQGEDPCGCTGKAYHAPTQVTTPSKEVVVVKVLHSSSIAELEYNTKTKVLKTIYTSGASYFDKEITQQEFEAVCNPSEEYQRSVGKAHHAIIKKKAMRS